MLWHFASYSFNEFASSNTCYIIILRCKHKPSMIGWLPIFPKLRTSRTNDTTGSKSFKMMPSNWTLESYYPITKQSLWWIYVCNWSNNFTTLQRKSQKSSPLLMLQFQSGMGCITEINLRHESMGMMYLNKFETSWKALIIYSYCSILSGSQILYRTPSYLGTGMFNYWFPTASLTKKD